MNVLIIEDNNTKFQTTIRTLESLDVSTTYTHIDNYTESMKLVSNAIETYDLIILDLMFFTTPSKNTYRHISNIAGCRFLSYLVYYYANTKVSKKVDVLIYSEEKDYTTYLKKHLFPSIREYDNKTETSHFYVTHALKCRYEELINRNQKLFDSIDFVIGHAHNETELLSLLTTWAENYK